MYRLTYLLGDEVVKITLCQYHLFNPTEERAVPVQRGRDLLHPRGVPRGRHGHRPRRDHLVQLNSTIMQLVKSLILIK